MIGDCEDARDHFGIEVECGPDAEHHPSRLVEVECAGHGSFLVCHAVAHDAEFVIDSHETYSRLMSYLVFQESQLRAMSHMLDRIGFASVKDPVAWAEAEAIPFLGSTDDPEIGSSLRSHIARHGVESAAATGSLDPA